MYWSCPFFSRQTLSPDWGPSSIPAIWDRRSGCISHMPRPDGSDWETVSDFRVCLCIRDCPVLIKTTIFNVFNGSSNGGSAYSLCFTFAINLSSSLTSSSSSVSSSNDEDICLHFLVLQQQVLLWCYFITVSKFSLNPQPQSIPFAWVFRLISPGIIDAISIRTTYCYPQNVHSPLLIYSFSGLQIACSVCSVYFLNQGLQTPRIVMCFQHAYFSASANFFACVDFHYSADWQIKISLFCKYLDKITIANTSNTKFSLMACKKYFYLHWFVAKKRVWSNEGKERCGFELALSKSSSSQFWFSLK